MRRTIDQGVVRRLLRPLSSDRRVVEVTKLAILALIDAGIDVSRNAVRLQAARVVPPSGRKPGITKSTLDRNAACRTLFEAATAHVTLTRPTSTSRVDAHVARMRRAELHALAGRYQIRATERLEALNKVVTRLRSMGRSFDLSSLEPLRTIRDGLRANRVRKARSTHTKTTASYRLSVSLVRRSIARLRSTGAPATRSAIVAGTAPFNKGTPLSDATIDRNVDCMRLVDKATGSGDPRLPPAPNHLRHRDLADAVMAERALWREARRLAFLATALLADHEDAAHRLEAERRVTQHYAALAEADRMIAAAKAATSRAASPRETSPLSTS
jgi:hypothetical protein